MRNKKKYLFLVLLSSALLITKPVFAETDKSESKVDILIKDESTNKWSYYDKNGNKVKNKVVTIKGKDYAFDSNGYTTYGFILVNNSWYFASKDLAIIKNDITQNNDGNYYAFDASGKMVSSRWYQLPDKKWVYANDSGALIRNQIKRIYGLDYGFNNLGYLSYNDWILDSNTGLWAFTDAQGVKVINQIKNIKGVDYLFGADGFLKNQWVKLSDKWYFSYDNGVLTKDGVIKDRFGWYYAIKSDGSMVNSGWHLLSNKKWVYANDGGLLLRNQIKHIYDSDYGFNEQGYLITNDWILDYSTHLWAFMDSQGSKVTNQIKNIKGVDYLFGADGFLKNQWVKLSDKWYFSYDNGVLTKDGVIKDRFGGYYAIKSDGSMVNSGWHLLSNKKWVYANDGGLLLRNQIKHIYDSDYGFNEQGYLVTNDWILDYSTHLWAFMDSQGSKVTNQIKNIKGVDYLFGADGFLKNQWVKLSDKWYFSYDNGILTKDEVIIDNFGGYYAIKSDGSMLNSGWYQLSNKKWVYADNGGSLARNQVKRIYGLDYGFNEQGYLVTDNWVLDYNTYLWAFIDNEGVKITNQIKNINGIDYLFGADGFLKTQWLYINNGWYFSYDNGQVVKNKASKINGTNYVFDNSGKLVSNAWIYNKQSGWTWGDSDGKAPSLEIRNINNVNYLFDANGYLYNGTLTISDGRIVSSNKDGIVTAVKSPIDWEYSYGTWRRFDSAYNIIDSAYVGYNAIIVSIEKQKLWLINNGQVVKTTDVVTGNLYNGTLTPPGHYKVQVKQTNRYLQGPGYKSWVNYWIQFDGNYGIHDASWQPIFGGEWYKHHGSKGCVNTPLNAISYIYDHINIGNPVIVY